MKPTMKKGGIFILAFVLLAAAAAAGPVQGAPQARAKLRDNINTLRLLRMTEALELTEAQTAKLFPALTRIDKERAELQDRIGADLRELRAAVGRSPVREADILAIVQRIREMRGSIRQKDEEFDAVLDESLTPVQKGKYVIFLVDFARGLGEKLKEARQGRQGQMVR
jgi:Spy/CpxP family protein refolding chaperone